MTHSPPTEMPTYEYLCTDCEHRWEEIQKISEAALEVCPKCAKSTAKRQISAGNFILKGGGWYADLYSSQPKSGGGSGESSASASSATTTKPESTAPAAAPATSSPSPAPAGGGTGGSSST